MAQNKRIAGPGFRLFQTIKTSFGFCPFACSRLSVRQLAHFLFLTYFDSSWCILSTADLHATVTPRTHVHFWFLLTIGIEDYCHSGDSFLFVAQERKSGDLRFQSRRGSERKREHRDFEVLGAEPKASVLCEWPRGRISASPRLSQKNT